MRTTNRFLTRFRKQSVRRADRRGSVARQLADRELGLEALEARQLLAANPLITEFMADNDDNVGAFFDDSFERDFGENDPFGDGSSPDWIELFNAGDEALDLEGYHLTDDSDSLTQWTFPSTLLEPGGYLLVYAAGMSGLEQTDFVDEQGNLHTNFGLDNEGDYLALVAPDGTTILSEFATGGRDFPKQLSDVSYGFVQTSPLIHARSDVSYWIPLGGDLGTSWTEPDFDPAANDFTPGKASLGFETRPNDRTNFAGEFETELPLGSHAAYVRMEFDVQDPSTMSSLLLRLKYDNAYVMYLNGTEVGRENVQDNVSWFSTAVSNSPRDSSALRFVDIPLDEHVGLLNPGKNVLGIHLLNNLSDNSDMLLVTELFGDKPITQSSVGYLVTPTPGAANIVFDAFTGPLISHVTQNPGAIADDQDLVVTAIVREHNAPIDSIELNYRVMFEDEAQVAMVDDGTGGDQMAGDGIYSATIPASISAPGEMVRWRVTASDTAGGTSRWPLFADSIDSDEYFGTIVADPSIESNLPVLHWFIDNPRGAESARGAAGSFFYLGEFYDNVIADNHGQSSTGFPKKSYDIDFNQGNRFKWQEGEGRVRDINLLSIWADKGKFRNALSYEMYRDSGGPYLYAFSVRVEQNGEFFSISDMVEDADNRTLERLGLNPDGALYKMYTTFTGAREEKKTRKWEDQTDLQELHDATRLRGDEWINYAFDNLDIPEIVNFLTGFDITSNHDCCHKNYYFFRDTGQTDEWMVLPWDVDLSFGHNWTSSVNYFKDSMDTNNGIHVGGNNALITKLYNASQTPGFREMYHRRLRTLMDKMIQPVDTPYEERYIEARLDELIALMDPNDDPFDPTPQGAARNGTVMGTDDADLDYNKWGSWDHGNGSRLHAARGETMREHIDRIKTDFLPARRANLYGQRDVPDAQQGNPILNFGEIEVSPASGDQAEEYIQLINSNNTAVDITGWRLTGGVEFTFPAGTVIPSGWTLYVAAEKNAFRARAEGPNGGQGLFIVGGWEGELSSDGESLALIGADDAVVRRTFVGELGDPTPVQQSLRITEVNYAPYAPNLIPGANEMDDGTPQAADAFEFIELTNTGRQTLDLTGVSLGAGVEFSFPDATTVGAGEQILVVKNQAAFESRYGTGLSIAGEYTGDLKDTGDSIFLDDAGDLPIPGQAFGYRTSGDWSTRAAGNGSSLQVISTNDTYDDASNWRASAEFGGSPGTRSQAVASPVLISEVLPNGAQPQGDMIELFNTTGSEIDVSNWLLSNSTDDYFQYALPASTTIPARGYVAFDQGQFGFDLNSWRGDTIWLIQTDSNGRPTQFADQISFAATGQGVSVGPFTTGDPDRPVITGQNIIVPLSETTLGAANAPRDPGDVIITEIQYNPLDLDGAGRQRASDFEYLELYNRSEAPVDLGDWLLTVEGDGNVTSQVDFEAGTMINAGETLIFVPFDITSSASASTKKIIFQFTYNVPFTTPIVGGERRARSFKLIEVDSRSARLERRDAPPPQEPGFTPMLLVDQVIFGAESPWPADAIETNSLTRIAEDAYGLFPTSWAARPSSPGTVEFFERFVGDSNDDGEFNQLDITLVLQGGKYNTGQPASHAEGDWTGDGLFNQLDVVAALQADTYLQGPLMAKSAEPHRDAADEVFAELWDLEF